MNAAGQALESVQTEGFGENIMAAYNDISAKVNEKYLASMYQEGYSAYSKGDYQTAAEKLAKVAETDESYQDGNAIYYLAQSYRRLNQMEDALVYYQKVLEQHPGTERARVAKSYLDANGGQTQDGQSGTQDGQRSSQDGQSGTQDGQGGTQDEQGQQDGQGGTQDEQGQQPDSPQQDGQQPEPQGE